MLLQTAAEILAGKNGQQTHELLRPLEVLFKGSKNIHIFRFKLNELLLKANECLFQRSAGTLLLLDYKALYLCNF